MQYSARQQDRMSSRYGDRRSFLKYLVGSTLASVTLGYCYPRSAQGHAEHSSVASSVCQQKPKMVAALDSQGRPLQAKALLSRARPGDRVLAQGLPEKTGAYLVINESQQIAGYAIKPVCPHHGCAVQWQAATSEFFCPCHGSKFDALGRVLKGPAKESLPLVTVTVDRDRVRLADCRSKVDPR